MVDVHATQFPYNQGKCVVWMSYAITARTVSDAHLPCLTICEILRDGRFAWKRSLCIWFRTSRGPEQTKL